MFIRYTTLSHTHLTITGTSVWLHHQQQQPPSQLANYEETTNLRNNYSEVMPSFGRVPNTIEVMPGQTVVLSCIVNNLGDRTVSQSYVLLL